MYEFVAIYGFIIFECLHPDSLYFYLIITLELVFTFWRHSGRIFNHKNNSELHRFVFQQNCFIENEGVNVAFFSLGVLIELESWNKTKEQANAKCYLALNFEFS